MPEQIIRPSAPASGRVTPASFPFYTTGEDNLRLISFNAAAGVKLKLNARSIEPSGKVTPDSWDHTPNTDRSAATSDYTLSGTTLLNLTVFAAAGAPQMGQTFVIVQLIRGLGAAALVLGTILQGYVTPTQALGFPGSPLQSSLDAGGYFRTLIGTAPALATPIVETVPAGARWEFHGIRQTVSMTVNNLHPVMLEFKDASGNIIGGAQSAFNMNVLPTVNDVIFTAGDPKPYSNSVFAQAQVFSGLGYPIVLQAGSTFTVFFFPTADYQFSAPTYLIREWLEP